MNRIGIITQARTMSTRLPGKVLIEVGGVTLLDHHLDRLLTSGIEVYVATTTDSSDDPIVDIASRRGLGYHRGSASDVLSRFDECARSNNLDVVVRVTSDCPLVDGRIVASAVVDFCEAGDPYLYLSNTLHRTFPRGFDFEVFSAQALAEAASEATRPAHREHVTPYLYAGVTGRMTLRDILWHQDRSSFRLTIDTPQDLALIRELIEVHKAHRLDCAEIITLLVDHPELVAINANVAQKKLSD